MPVHVFMFRSQKRISSLSLHYSLPDPEVGSLPEPGDHFLISLEANRPQQSSCFHSAWSRGYRQLKGLLSLSHGS